MAQAHLIILIVFCSIYWLILSPILCYTATQFYQLRYTQIVRKRFYKLTVFLAISSIVTITIYSPFYLLRIYFIALNKRFIVMDLIYVTIYSFCIYSISTLLALRFWCLWYYVKWTKATLDEEWKIHISKEECKNWFIINQEKYGTIQYASRIAATYLLIGMILFCIPRYVTVIQPNNSLASIIAALFNLLILALPLISGCVMWFKTPIFNDSFDLVREHRLMARILVILIILYLAVYITPTLGATEYTRWMLGNVMSASFSFTASIFPIIYAIYIAFNQEDYIVMSPSLRAKTSSNGQFRFSFDRTRSRSRPIQNNSTQLTSEKSNQNVSVLPQMIKCVGNDFAFGAFINHLSNEFSMELALAFIELTQYKKLILSVESTDTIDNEMLAQQENILNNDLIPKSFIVYKDIEEVLEYHNDNRRRTLSALPPYYTPNKENTNGNTNGNTNENGNNDGNDKLLNELQIRGYVLYCKYLDTSATFQINVSDGESKTLLHKLAYRSQLGKEDLFTLYDQTLKELWQLLRHSFYRFIKTTEYKDLLQYLQ